jgi:DNA-binding LacI/PurR family transcriptional regulator
LKKLKNPGLVIPDGIAQITFDENGRFDFLYSPITYIRQDLSAMEKKSVSFFISTDATPVKQK